MKGIKYRKREFEARLAMERAAQHDIGARLKAIELRMETQAQSKDGGKKDAS